MGLFTRYSGQHTKEKPTTLFGVALEAPRMSRTSRTSSSGHTVRRRKRRRQSLQRSGDLLNRTCSEGVVAMSAIDFSMDQLRAAINRIGRGTARPNDDDAKGWTDATVVASRTTTRATRIQLEGQRVAYGHLTEATDAAAELVRQVERLVERLNTSMVLAPRNAQRPAGRSIHRNDSLELSELSQTRRPFTSAHVDPVKSMDRRLSSSDNGAIEQPIRSSEGRRVRFFDGDSPLTPMQC
jgi:hypothetical protein